MEEKRHRKKQKAKKPKEKNKKTKIKKWKNRVRSIIGSKTKIQMQNSFNFNLKI
jgi:hypothetical protein